MFSAVSRRKLLSAASYNFRPNPVTLHQRSIWGWLNSIFNKYDASRVEEVGPDRACAEWLIRCGAGVKWSKDSDWFRDYNALPPVDTARKLYIHEIDGTDSAVMYHGFRHLEGLKYCRRLVLHKAYYVDDEALRQLFYLQNCLEDLQISACGNVSDKGIMTLSQLSKLKKLLLYDLPEVRNKQRCVEFLTRVLPGCKVNFPYAQASENDSSVVEKDRQEKK